MAGQRHYAPSVVMLMPLSVQLTNMHVDNVGVNMQSMHALKTPFDDVNNYVDPRVSLENNRLTYYSFYLNNRV